MSDRRMRKRLVTRQAISNAGTRLFLERGFDRVTVDEIADAADVGRMTVFNHFSRKEDIFFDRDEEGRAMVQEILRLRDENVGPFERLRLHAHRLIEENSPYVEFSVRSQAYIVAIESSETLKARARAIRDELAQLVATTLCETMEQDPADPNSDLAAAMLLAIWATAFIQAHRLFKTTQNAKEAKALFLAIIDQGTLGLKASLAGTPYV